MNSYRKKQQNLVLKKTTKGILILRNVTSFYGNNHYNKRINNVYDRKLKFEMDIIKVNYNYIEKLFLIITYTILILI